MGKDKKTKKPVVSSSSSSDSDSPPPKKVDKKKAKKDKKEVEKKKAEPVKKDKKSKKKVESSDSDSSDAKPVKKRERAASNVSAASKGSANKAQKKSEKAVVPQKKSKDQDSSSESDFIPDPSVLKFITKETAQKDSSSSDSSSSDSGSDEKPAPKKADKKTAKKAESSSDEKEEAKVETPAAVSTEHDGKLELYVSNLSFNTSESELRIFFQSYGKIAKCKLLLNMGQKSRCKAFIEYYDHQHAKAALNGRTGQDLDGSAIRVEWIQTKAGGAKDGETKSIFIGNLGFTTEVWALEEVFKSCGTIVNCKIGLDQDGQAKGYAHVDFDSSAAALEALKLAGTEIDGRAVRVDLSIKRGSKGDFGESRRGGDRGRGGARGFGNRGGNSYGRGGYDNYNSY